ncbi:hypothetical protein KI387_038542 [Taxus chinensis]|uniref:Nitrate regulatory gene2 protein-like n=1 Tax=Taxus chinensis TaxID=29808 RepID=A0AA38F748_TAXCH|nr:hypothetical protein KI387_038542 [Taxus chinensis]
MGCSNSKIEDEDVLIRCRERKRFIKLVMENRYALAAAHVAYIEALRNIGHGLRQFTEAELTLESSLATSTTVASELAVLHGKSPSPSPFPSSSSSRSLSPSPLHSLSPVRVESSSSHKSLASHDSNSPTSYASPQMNFMRSGGVQAVTVEERPPAGERGTLESFSSAPQSKIDHDPSSPRPATPPSASPSQKTVPPPPVPSSCSWDFFNPFTPLDNPYHFPDHGDISHSPERELVDLEQVREEEGIPDLEDGDQGEQSMEEKIEKVNSEKRTSGADLGDPYTKISEIASRAVVNGTHSQEHVAVSSADALTQGPPKPSVAAMPQFTSKAMVEDIPSIDAEGNEAEAMKAAEKASALGKDKEVTDKDSILEKELTTVISAPSNRNFLDSIKEIENWFIRAYESGKEVCRMLEANKVHYHSSFPETKGKPRTSRLFIPYSICCFKDPGETVAHEPSSWALKLITWNRSTSSLSSSSKTPFVSISKDDIDDSSSDFVEDLCMISGSHASTLERLYAWEKKLYDEVKAEECIRRVYEKKRAQLRNQETEGKSQQVIDKTRAAIKDLHSRIRVGIHAVDSVSMRIQRLRDEELQPQLVELIQGLVRMWEVMLVCHQTQHRIITEANTPSHPAGSGISSESHRQATVHLGNELQNWQLRFSNWIGAQKAYVQALHGWLQKCLLEEAPDASTKRRRQVIFSPRRVGAPLVVIICTDWSRAFEPVRKTVCDAKKEETDKSELVKDIDCVLKAINDLAGDVSKILLQRDEQRNQKRKAEIYLDGKVASIQRSESRKSEEKVRRYHKVMEQTDGMFLNTLQKGLTGIFASLTEFAKQYTDDLQDIIKD